MLALQASFALLDLLLHKIFDNAKMTEKMRIIIPIMTGGHQGLFMKLKTFLKGLQYKYQKRKVGIKQDADFL